MNVFTEIMEAEQVYMGLYWDKPTRLYLGEKKFSEVKKIFAKDKEVMLFPTQGAARVLGFNAYVVKGDPLHLRLAP